jgi:dienelactone hydrolase
VKRVVVALVLAAGLAVASDEGRILEHVPDAPDPDARYVFYLHGRIIEVQGPEAVSPDFGRYEYRKILETFATPGFQVVAEVREDGAGAEFVEATAAQVRRLLEAGVPGDQITVVGFSKGGLMTLDVAAAVASDEVSYAILAGCRSDPGWVASLGPRLRGRFLSLRDRSDRFSASCEALFARATAAGEKREHVFETGLDHGLFYRPRPDWVDRVVGWAAGADE